MQRSDYAHCALSLDQYNAIINGGSMGKVSPMLGAEEHTAFMDASQGINCDPRVLLAGIQFESHYGCDVPALTEVCNLSGIIYAGQDYAYRSDVLRPLNERPRDPNGDLDSSHYAGFVTLGDFYKEFARTMTNIYVGPHFNRGDLVMAWAVYVGGPGNPNIVSGNARVDQWLYFLDRYPPEGATPVPDGVYGEDLITIMAAHDGERMSDGTLDSWNHSHLWEGWCQASVEGVRDEAGLEVVHRASAAVQLDTVITQGLLRSGRPEHGAICMWGRSFDIYGHTCLWDEDKGMFLSTLYNPSRIGYYYSDSWYNALAGWWRAPGVVDARRGVQPPTPELPAVDTWYVDDNPYGAVPVKHPFWSRWDQLNAMGTPLDHPGAVNPDGLALPHFGYPVAPERTLATGRRVQQFERVVLAENIERQPWDVVSLLISEAISMGIELHYAPARESVSR